MSVARPKSFDVMLLRQMSDVRRYAGSLCRDSAEAEDLTQTVAMLALRAWASFQPGTNFGAWLATICRNAFINGSRRSWRVVYSDDMTEYDSLLQVSAHDKVLEAQETTAMIGPILQADANAVIGLIGAGATYVEVAERLSIPEGTVRSRLSRARAALKANGLAP